MSSENKTAIVSQEDIMKVLDSCYEKCLNGIPKVSPDVGALFLTQDQSPQFCICSIRRRTAWGT